MNTLPCPVLRCCPTTRFHRNLEWWNDFLDAFNGQCEFLHQRPVTSLQINACIIGLAAFFERDWFYYNILVDGFSDFHFKYKENICVVLSACRWCHTWYNKIVFVYCDNTAAVDMLNKDTTKSPTIMHFLGGLFRLSAVYNFHIKAFHVAGDHKILADNASRFHEFLHLQGFLSYMLGSGSNAVNISAVSHMSVSCYIFWLTGTYSLPII